MHIKFIKRGKGSASAAKEYLLQEYDNKGVIRADVQVLRGNPEHVTLLADSLEFKHRYTSGVIAWHKDDAPTDNQIAQVLDDFERVAFAGLEPNQYSYYAVLHKESDGSKHVHVITPRVELSTGLSMNIAPPNHQKTYDVLVDKYNTKHNWASPKDLHRRKLVNNQVQLHSNMNHTKAKVEINKAVQELIAKGTLKNENDIAKYLNSIDGVTVNTRRSKKNLSITLEGIKKPIRLEGLAYAKGFNAGELRQELRAEQEARVGETTADRTREYERISEVFENIITDRAKFNQGRYIRDAKERQPKQQDLSQEQQGVQRRGDAELERSESRTHQDKSQAMDNTHSHRDINSPSPSIRNVGRYEVPLQPTPNTKRSDSTDRENTRQVRDKELEQRNRREERADNMGRPREWTLDSSVREKQIKEHYDAVRERIKSNLADTRADVQGRIRESNESLREAFNKYHHSVYRADEKSVGSDRTAEQDVKQIREHINKLANQHRQGTNGRYRELIQTAKGRVGELTATVRRFKQKAITKVKELAKRAERSISRGFGMSR